MCVFVSSALWGLLDLLVGCGVGTCSPASAIRPSARPSGRRTPGAPSLLDGKYGHLQLDFKAWYLGVGDHLLASFLLIKSFITKAGRVLNCFV